SRAPRTRHFSGGRSSSAETFCRQKILSSWSPTARRLRAAPQARCHSSLRSPGKRTRRNRLRLRKGRQILGFSRRPAASSGHTTLCLAPGIRRNSHSSLFRPHSAPRQTRHLPHLGPPPFRLIVVTSRRTPSTHMVRS